MPQWWYDVTYDPFLASVLSGIIVGAMMLGFARLTRPHCPRCCPSKRDDKDGS